MAAPTTASPACLYRLVIENVIAASKSFFEEEGVDPKMLEQLQKVWEARLQLATSATENRTPEQEVPSTPTPTHQERSHRARSLHLTSPSPITSPLTSATVQAFEAIGRPQQYMPPRADWLPPSKPVLPPSLKGPEKKRSSRGKRSRDADDGDGDDDDAWEPSGSSARNSTPRQLDGGDDSSDEEDDGAPQRRRRRRTTKSKKEAKQQELEREHHHQQELQSVFDEGESVGDDSDLDISGDEEPDTDNLVLCQYETITRVKNKRKCQLVSGLVTLNGRDYLFSKANGEFDF